MPNGSRPPYHAAGPPTPSPTPPLSRKETRPVLLTAWLARLSDDLAPLLNPAAARRAVLKPAVVPVWDGAPGDVRRPGGRRARRRRDVRAEPRLAFRQRLA